MTVLFLLVVLALVVAYAFWANATYKKTPPDKRALIKRGGEIVAVCNSGYARVPWTPNGVYGVDYIPKELWAVVPVSEIAGRVTSPSLEVKVTANVQLTTPDDVVRATDYAKSKVGLNAAITAAIRQVVSSDSNSYKDPDLADKVKAALVRAGSPLASAGIRSQDLCVEVGVELPKPLVKAHTDLVVAQVQAKVNLADVGTLGKVEGLRMKAFEAQTGKSEQQIQEHFWTHSQEHGRFMDGCQKALDGVRALRKDPAVGAANQGQDNRGGGGGGGRRGRR